MKCSNMWAGYMILVVSNGFAAIAHADSSPNSSFSAESGRLKPSDYLFGPNSERKNDLFDGLKPVEASVNLAVGSDCGRINVEGTLKSTFGKVLNGDYFKGLAQDILGSAPMLAACYMSPTWCSILKHTQLSANFLTQTRLNQCQIIDKYTDSRVEDYYRDRQSCIQKSIEANGGDMESAMASCQNNVFQAKAGKWAGASKDDPNAPDALIGDSAKWAGFDGDESKRVTELLKSMVGDTVLAQGTVRVEYGTRAHPYSPRSHLISLEQTISTELCGKLLADLAQDSATQTYINNDEIYRRMKSLDASSDNEGEHLVRADVIRNLAYLPPNRRDRICTKLSQTLAMASFTLDMNRSLDVLTAAAQNPNLPPNRKQEIEAKRAALKDQVELTLRLRQEQAKPVGEVLQYISSEGETAQDEATRSVLAEEASTQDRHSHFGRMNDCSDGVFCEGEIKPVP